MSEPRVEEGAAELVPVIPADSAVLRTPDPAPPPSVASLAELIAARERRNMDIVLVSSRLRLAQKQIIALEAGNWDVLPGRTFVRGSLRSYGKLLEVDVEPLLSSIDAALPGSEVLKPRTDLRRPMPRQGALGFGGSGPGSRWVWLLLAVVAVVALAFFYGGGPELLNRDRPMPSGRGAPAASPPAANASAANASAANASAANASAANPSAANASAANPSAAVLPGTRLVAAEAAPPATASTAASGAAASLPILPPAATAERLLPALPSAPAAQPASVSPTAPVAPPSSALQPAPGISAEVPALPVVRAPPRASGTGNPLILRFSGESWIEVRDASGTVVATGTQQAGMVREFDGEGPFSLIIGNAVAASLTWRGTPVDLAPHMRLGIVRLRVE